MSNAGFKDRPYAAGRGGLVCLYAFGAPAAFGIVFLAVASAGAGGVGAISDSDPLLGVGIATAVCVLAAVVSLFAAIIQAYSADTAADVPSAGHWAVPAAAADQEVTDPWAGHEVAPGDDRLTDDELAPAA